jgi:SAM-dependent methyltransferase
MPRIGQKIPESLKQFLRPLYHRLTSKNPPQADMDARWLEVQERLKRAKNVIDLGCGNSPVRGAKTCVDLYIEPIERGLGTGQKIDIESMKERGITFLNARIDTPLPFRDREFDFAYSHHAFEHVDDPATACNEMMRIASSGVIITPSFFAELIFGRTYHKWLVMEREDTIFFFRKRLFEDRPFGNHPIRDEKSGSWVVREDTNPFDILLNDKEWYRGPERLPRLAQTLRKYWYAHAPLMEVIFIWDEKFKAVVYE